MGAGLAKDKKIATKAMFIILVTSFDFPQSPQTRLSRKIKSIYISTLLDSLATQAGAKPSRAGQQEKKITKSNKELSPQSDDVHHTVRRQDDMT